MRMMDAAFFRIKRERTHYFPLTRQDTVWLFRFSWRWLDMVLFLLQSEAHLPRFHSRCQ